MNQTFVFEHHYQENGTQFTEIGFPKSASIAKELRYEQSVPWMNVVDEFLDFLGAVYGFDIKGQVKYKDPF